MYVCFRRYLSGVVQSCDNRVRRVRPRDLSTKSRCGISEQDDPMFEGERTNEHE